MTELPYGLFEDELIREGTRKENTASRLFEKSEEELKKGESRIYYVGAKTTNLQGKASISGYVKEAANGEPMIGASVYVENPLIGVATDQFGYFLITLPKGRHSLKVKSIGMKTLTRQVMLFADGKIDIELEQDITPLKALRRFAAPPPKVGRITQMLLRGATRLTTGRIFPSPLVGEGGPRERLG